VRRALVLLLLLAATVHPFAHLWEDSGACPCVHGAVAVLVPPSLDGPAATTAMHVPYRSAALVASIAGQVPARAPPAA
jgi:hypothetical protein